VKPSWQFQEYAPVQVLAAGLDKAGNSHFQAQTTLSLKRQITPAFWIAAAVLLLVYLLIASEVMHRTLAAFWVQPSSFITYTAGTFDKNYHPLFRRRHAGHRPERHLPPYGHDDHCWSEKTGLFSGWPTSLTPWPGAISSSSPLSSR
jgi:hypothetical protein